MKKRIARFKIYTDRARWDVGYVQLLLMVAIFLKTNGIDVPVWAYPLMLLVIIFGFILFGFLETKLGILQEEQNKYAEQNPIMMQILNELRELKK
jgi:hypothetical protein